MTESLNLCVYCKYHSETVDYSNPVQRHTIYVVYLCRRVLETRTDMVTGGKVKLRAGRCHDERAEPDVIRNVVVPPKFERCGPEGKFWEAKV